MQGKAYNQTTKTHDLAKLKGLLQSFSSNRN